MPTSAWSGSTRQPVASAMAAKPYLVCPCGTWVYQHKPGRPIWECADPVQQELLTKAGLSKPPAPQPELAELCRRYEETLPEEIQEALAAMAAAEPKQTPQQQLSEASRNFKAAAQKLRALIASKAALQAKLDRQKKEYQESLDEMKKLTQEEQDQQTKVSDLQKELQAAVPTKAPAPLPVDLLEALTKAGVTAEQVQAAQEHLAHPPQPRAPNPTTSDPVSTNQEGTEGKGTRREARSGRVTGADRRPKRLQLSRAQAGRTARGRRLCTHGAWYCGPIFYSFDGWSQTWGHCPQTGWWPNLLNCATDPDVPFSSFWAAGTRTVRPAVPA